MSTFYKFEDIEAWKKSRVLSQEINGVAKYSAFKNDPDLKRQLKLAEEIGKMLEGLMSYLRRSEIKGPK